MNNFRQDRDFRNFDNRSFGNRNRSFGNRGGDRPRMVRAICDQCGRDCELPFKPTGDKPVYCSDCFEKINGGGRSNNRRFESRDTKDYRQENTRNSEMESINRKLDRILDLLTVKEAKKIKEEKRTKISKPKKVKEILDLDIKEIEIPAEIETPVEKPQE